MRKQSNSLNFILLKKVLIDHSTFRKYILNTYMYCRGDRTHYEGCRPWAWRLKKILQVNFDKEVQFNQGSQ